MENLAQILPIVIDILLILLLIIGIILGIKLIITIDNVNDVVSDVKKKVKALDSVFNIVDLISNKFSSLTGTVVEWFVKIFGKLKNLKQGKDDEEEYE